MCGVGRDEMRSLLTWLDPAASPRITIGVGEPGLLKSGYRSPALRCQP